MEARQIKPVNQVNRVWVVGDKFAHFGSQPPVICYSVLMQHLQQSSSASVATYHLRLGQGLNGEEIASLARLCRVRPELSLAPMPKAASPCAKAIVHKAQQHNVMISAPTVTSDTSFAAHLLLDDDCDEMADHVTGHHLQGSVLAEAARQMVLAVSELHLLPAAKRGRMRFITHSSMISFAAYAFPLDVVLSMQVETIKRGFGGNFTATLAVRFQQNSTDVAQAEFTFSALDATYLDEQEAALATAACRD